MEAIFAAAFAWLLSVVLLWTGLKQLRNRAALDRWPTTKGRVIERGTFIPDFASGPPAFRHAPLVKYVYQVGGKDFVSDRLQPKQIQQPRHNTEAWAQKRAAEFPDEVDVHYNPEDPSESFLLQTPKILLYTLIVGSCVALLFGVILLLIK